MTHLNFCYRHRVIIASTAFGIGVNIPDIRQVIFIQPAGSLPEFVQQIGRGGRDGRKCIVKLHYNNIELGKSPEEMKKLINAECPRVSVKSS